MDEKRLRRWEVLRERCSRKLNGKALHDFWSEFDKLEQGRGGTISEDQLKKLEDLTKKFGITDVLPAETATKKAS